MDNDLSLEIVSEILQGVTVLSSSFGSLYLKHLSQFDQRELISKSKLFKKEALSKGLSTEKDALQDLIKHEIWSEKNEEKIKNLNSEIENLKKINSQLILPSKKKDMQKQLKDKQNALILINAEKEDLLGLTVEKYSNNKIQKNIVSNMLFYDKQFTKSVFEDLYVDEMSKEIEVYKIQKSFFEKFNDDSISKAALSDNFSVYLPFCEDVLGVFGKPLSQLTTHQLKLISFGRYFLNIFKNSNKEIPENVAKDPELLISFYENQKEGSKRHTSKSDEGGSTYFGATKEDLKSIKTDDENVVVLSEEIKKQGGSLNMQQMMDLHKI